jgi:crotonobetaine/carnitine-CoA ligase
VARTGRPAVHFPIWAASGPDSDGLAARLAVPATPSLCIVTPNGAVTGEQSVTFDALWRRAVAADPDALFLRYAADDGTVARWTYGEFDQLVEGAAVRLEQHGVSHGDAVHLALTNSPTFVAVWLAAVRLGASIVPSDPMATARELAEHLARTTPQVGFAATERLDVYRHAGELDGSVLPATVIDVAESDTSLGWLTPANAGDRPRPAIRDRAAVMFTSGTTGRPKGVEITQANYAFAGTTMAAACDLTPDDRYLVVLPLFHANAQYYSFAAAIAVGASVALMPSFSASRFVEQAADHGATCASLFAGPIRMILTRGGPLTGDHPALRLRHCWYAQNLTSAQFDTISEWLGCRPRQLYGMTETIPAVLTDHRDDPRCDAMGFVTDGCLVDLQDGEIVVGGEPGITLFAGYLDDTATTAASFRDGWFLTGDRATRDDNGRYRFAGRRSDVLKVAGENVSVVEVEEVLALHPGVADVAVVGVPDPVRDEVPVAVVVPAADAGQVDDLRAELEAWCAERLGKTKRPREYRFVVELPRTSVGKIKKYQLRG